MNDRRVLKALLASSMMPIPNEALSLRYQRLIAARDAVVMNRDNDETSAKVAALFAILAEEFPSRPTVEQKPFARELIADALIDHEKLNNWSDGQTSILEDLVANVAVARALVRNYGVRLTQNDILVWMSRHRDYLANF